MIELCELTAARRYGEIWYLVENEHTGTLSQLLGKFGLIEDESLLKECDRDGAFEILVNLFWKDMAYGVECMPKHKAELLAERIFAETKSADSKYFSNGNMTKNASWNPLTESTFDSGIIVVNSISRQHFCIWFQDED